MAKSFEVKKPPRRGSGFLPSFFLFSFQEKRKAERSKEKRKAQRKL
jgi:hypothetical protein